MIKATIEQVEKFLKLDIDWKAVELEFNVMTRNFKDVKKINKFLIEEEIYIPPMDLDTSVSNDENLKEIEFTSSRPDEEENYSFDDFVNAMIKSQGEN